jgi:hypothetical protein
MRAAGRRAREVTVVTNADRGYRSVRPIAGNPIIAIVMFVAVQSAGWS